MSNLLKRIEKEVLIGPGDLPVNIVKKGHNLAECAEWWAVNHPEDYQELLKSWLNAGCDFIECYTGGANKFRLKKFGLQDKAKEITEKLARLTREVTPTNCYLFFNVPRLTMFLPPMGNASVDEAYESYVEQVLIAEEVGADLIRATIDDIEYMESCIRAIKEHSQLPISANVNLSPTPKGFRTWTGVEPVAVAKRLREIGVDFTGISCGSISYAQTTAVLKEMKTVWDKYFFVRPNAGVPEVVNGEVVYPGTPEDMANEAPRWVENGTKLIAGCCGTTPEHIAKLVAVLK